MDLNEVRVFIATEKAKIHKSQMLCLLEGIWGNNKMLQIIATNPRQIQKVIDTAKCPKQAITLARDYQTLFGTKWEIGIKQ